VVVEFSPPIDAKERAMELEVRPAAVPDDGCAAATMPVFKEDTEAPVLGQQLWEAVHERRAELASALQG
jgi:hypothetical protein